MEKIIIESGKSIKKTFEGLAMAGYIWEFKIDKNNIISIDKKFETVTNKMLVGGSANETFEIKGIEPGNTTIIFYQSRNWETGVEPIKTVTYQIEVI